MFYSIKECFYKYKGTGRQVSFGDMVFVFQPKLKMPKTRKNLQGKYHGLYIVVWLTNQAAVNLRNLANGHTLKKSININRLKVGYIRAKVNNWDPLDIDSDEKELEEDDMPPAVLALPV